MLQKHNTDFRVATKYIINALVVKYSPNGTLHGYIARRQYSSSIKYHYITLVQTCNKIMNCKKLIYILHLTLHSSILFHSLSFFKNTELTNICSQRN